MSALAFAWRGLVRQPARAGLGILGVAAVGALLFDMLLLSEGLVLSMRDLLERVGFDVRVRATMALPGSGPSIADAGRLYILARQLRGPFHRRRRLRHLIRHALARIDDDEAIHRLAAPEAD